MIMTEREKTRAVLLRPKREKLTNQEYEMVHEVVVGGKKKVVAETELSMVIWNGWLEVSS